MPLPLLLFTLIGAASSVPPHSANPQGPGTGTLIVTNMNDNTATVIDIAGWRVRATIPTGTGPHEAAATSDGRWAVVSNYGNREHKGSTLTVIDLAKAAVARTIDLGGYQRPHGMAFYPGDSLLLVTSEVSQNVLVVDFAAGKVVDTIPTGRPVSHMLALAKTGDRLYTTNIMDGSITTIDPRARKQVRVTAVARMVEGITTTPDGKQAWVGSNRDSIVVIIDGDQGRAVDTLKGFGMPYRLGITPNGKLAVISDPARAQIRIVDVATRKELHRVTVPATGVLPSAEFPGSPSPEGVTVASDNRWAYVTLQGRNQVIAVNLAAGTLSIPLPVGTSPDGIAYAPPIRR